MPFRAPHLGLVVLITLCSLGPAAMAQPGTPATPAAAASSPSLDDLLPYKPAETVLRALRAIETHRDRSAIPALIELLRFDLPVPPDLVGGVLEGLAGERLG